jgi:ABC-type multidrug transport system fused ATPase/permease subunit
VIAHRLSTIRNADQIIVIKYGEIAEIGSHNELLRNEDGEYKKLISRQLEKNKQMEGEGITAM